MDMKSFQPSEALSVCFRSVEKRPKDSRVKGLAPSLLLVMPSLKRHQHVFSFSAAVASKSCTVTCSVGLTSLMTKTCCQQ